MIANISPALTNITETQSTLRFAQRAKNMGNRARVNEDASGDVERLRQEVVMLRQRLADREQAGNAGALHQHAWHGVAVDLVRANFVCLDIILPQPGML